MRPDLNKLLCERERRGSRYNSFKQMRRRKAFAVARDPDGETLLVREGMRLRYMHAGDWKEFSENLSPLHGAVRKAVGRPWDKFYSELCEVFNMRSVINQHILTHLYQFIEIDLFLADGELMVRTKYSLTPTPLRRSDCEFYVDPRSRLIRRNKYRTTYRQSFKARRASRAQEEAQSFRKLSASEVLRKVGDTWFIFELRATPVDLGKLPAAAFDEFTRERVSRKPYKSHMGTRLVGPETYHARKRTAPRKLLRSIGL